MLILLSLLKNNNILYNLLNQVLTFFRCKKLDNRVSPIIDAIKANPEATHRLGYQINRDTFDAAHHSNAGIASVQAM